MKRRYSKTEVAAMQRALQEARRHWERDVAAMQRALQGHSERVGDTPAKQLTWLTDLIARDLDDTTLDGVAAELDWFAVHRGRAWVGTGSVKTARTIRQMVEPQDVRAIHQHLRELLTTLAPDTTRVLPRPVGDAVHWGSRHGVTLVSQRDSLAQVLAAVTDVLITIGPRLQRCETATCQRLFAQRRPGQKRCRVTCGATERVRQWRAQHRAAVSERQHAKYVRKVKTRQPLAKVRRRTSTRPAGVREGR